MPSTASDVDARPRVLSIASGVGGLDLGVRLAVPTSRVVCYVEREVYACAVLVSRMADGWLDEAPVWSDARSFDARPWRGCVDLVVGGYPCPPFSQAGKRLGLDDERNVWPDIARIVRELEPAACFFENVAGHLSCGAYEVTRELHGLGFLVAATLLSAEEVGAPHERNRLFVLAAHPDRVELRQLEQWVSRPGERGDFRARWEAVSRDHGQVTWGGPRPEIHRVDDGIPERMDRLRAVGNAVVPAQAAHAFRELATALIGLGDDFAC